MSAVTDPQPVVTRFAPSPTGALHIGGARTALFAWAYARKHRDIPGSKFILRFEDTDQKRSSKASARGIVRDMKWLGLDWDEGPSLDEDADPYTDQIGDAGPYTQSQRAEQGIYDQYIDLLLEAGEAYEDAGAVRLKMGEHRGDIAFDDAVFGHIEVKAADLEDFVIRKSEDGGRLPTFHFAVVIDDALMGVTHVIRGQEHLSNTTKHAALYDALAKLTDDPMAWARPVWVHTPSIMNPGGSKMSKRDKAKAARSAMKNSLNEASDWVSAAVDQISESFSTRGDGIDSFELGSFLEAKQDTAWIAQVIADHLGLRLPEIDVDDFKNSGYLPEVCLNYIALLGWNPGDDIERFDLAFLTEKFLLDRIGKANSTFDRDKLRSFNGDTIRAMPADDFTCLLADYVKAYRPDWHNAGIFNGGDWGAFCSAVQERTETLPMPLDANAYLIAEDDAIDYDFSPKPIRKAMTNSNGAGVKLLEELRAAFDGLPEANFGHAAHEKINELAETSGTNMGKYAQPVRIAVSGSTVTPPLDVTLDLLGKLAVLKRIGRCLAAANKHMEANA
ncbi:MAG: glutamate--tRNA ligase family protein [Planctomycetota bacterium]